MQSHAHRGAFGSAVSAALLASMVTLGLLFLRVAALGNLTDFEELGWFPAALVVGLAFVSALSFWGLSVALALGTARLLPAIMRGRRLFWPAWSAVVACALAGSFFLVAPGSMADIVDGLVATVGSFLLALATIILGAATVGAAAGWMLRRSLA